MTIVTRVKTFVMRQPGILKIIEKNNWMVKRFLFPSRYWIDNGCYR